ncbi:hypothetical protein AMTR_s00053p00037150 [Amborella trichopoda]|uniref:Uncharacterized protein n=1 Tax=Amborella trichopoda TaxID=13333 RepID=W1PBD2_AMBTC|nr:hypothetical protein AMTR_s00053p00037150 [Amborella trichopoda]
MWFFHGEAHFYFGCLHPIKEINGFLVHAFDIYVFYVSEWDPWGVPEDYKCEIIEDDTPGPKHVPRHRPIPLPDGFRHALVAAASVQPDVNKKEASEK